MVQIDAYPNICVVTGLPMDEGRRLFAFPTQIYSVDDEGHLGASLGYDESIAWSDLTDRWYFPRNKLESVALLLEQRGHEVEAIEHQPRIRPERCPVLLPPTNLPAWVQNCQEVLLQQMVGRIVVHDRRQQLDVIALVAMLHANANIILVSPTRGKFSLIRNHLGAIGPRTITESAFDLDGETSHIVLATTAEYFRPCPSYFQVVVFLDLHRSLGQQIITATVPLNEHCIYAIEHSSQPLERREVYRAEYLAGDVIFQLASAQTDRQLLTATVDSPFRQQQRTTTLDGKRRFIWQNASRNQLIADIAGDIAQRRSDRLTARIGSDHQLLSRPTSSVAILVESPEHARVLQQLLPDWSLLIGETLLGFFSFDRKILTQVSASRLSNLDVDFLIRADGGTNPLQFNGFPGRAAANNLHPAVLIQLNDGPTRH